MFVYTMKYLREMNMIPKNWRGALELYYIRKKTDKSEEVIFVKGKYYRKGKLLQVKKNGHFYYKDWLYEVSDQEICEDLSNEVEEILLQLEILSKKPKVGLEGLQYQIQKYELEEKLKKLREQNQLEGH